MICVRRETRNWMLQRSTLGDRVCDINRSRGGSGSPRSTWRGVRISAVCDGVSFRFTRSRLNVHRASFCRAFGHAGTPPPLIVVFSSAVSRCFGASTIAASIDLAAQREVALPLQFGIEAGEQPLDCPCRLQHHAKQPHHRPVRHPIAKPEAKKTH